ncbi:uncharacterized protein JCM6883_006745 [Sporobolomyces salmoneus]|uniref:uncharacterized protein n=1 Tax=Sporobolomyces salmoneus TaxID=183962 RepID=UPI003175111C
MTSISNLPRPVGGGSLPSLKSNKRSIKNPFRRQQGPQPSVSASSSPPAYSSLPGDGNSTVAPSTTTKQKAASLFSWKSSGKMSWIGFGSLKGKSEMEKQEELARKGKGGLKSEVLPSSAERLKSTYKRRQNRHGVLEFEFQRPFIVELDESLPPETRESVQLGSLAEDDQQLPVRSTFTPSPVPPVTRELPPSASLNSTSSTGKTSRLPRITESSGLPRPSKLPQPTSIPSVEPSPDLTKDSFATQFPLPPARRPSSAELLVSASHPTRPTKTILSPARINSPPPNRFTSSNFPRPKNGPFTQSNPYPSSSRLPTPSPSIGSSRITTPSPVSSFSTAPLSPRSPSQTSVRKPISIPAKPRLSNSSPSPRIAAITNNANAVVSSNKEEEARNRTSWESEATVTRNSSASGASEDTVIASSPSSAMPFSDLKKRTTITVETVPPMKTATTGGRREANGRRTDKLERSKGGEVINDGERKSWEQEVEDMFSEERMKDLLIQLGI